MTRDEKNRFIAEALGFLMPTPDETMETIASRRYEVRRWTLHRKSGAPIENFSSYYWASLDFYASEEANALVLEAMPAPELYKHAKDGVAPFAAWRCRADWGLDENTVHPDRKTAICEAFIAWRGKVQ